MFVLAILWRLSASMRLSIQDESQCVGLGRTVCLRTGNFVENIDMVILVANIYESNKPRM